MSIIDSDIEIIRETRMTAIEHKLSQEAWKKAKIIADGVYDFLLCKKRMFNVKIFPAVVASCCSRYRNEKIYTDVSKDERNRYYDHRLVDKIKQVGKIGHRPERIIHCEYRLGHCAEQHAANDLLREQRCTNLNEIYFGRAIRPRTGQYMAPCENCKYIFPILERYK